MATTSILTVTGYRRYLNFFIFSCFFFSVVSHAARLPLIEKNQRFHPVQSLKGLVASQSRLASKIGANILKQGGNAIDAAVAVGFAEAVTLPRAGNLGGGGFMLVWLNKSKKAIAINYREKAPAAATETMFQTAKGDVNYKKLKNSYLATGVPGTVAGLVYAQKNFGRLKLSKVIQPAIDLATNGIRVSPSLADVLRFAQKRLSKFSNTKKTFYKADGTFYRQGDVMKRPDLAKTLIRIAKQGEQGFYQGITAKRMVKTIQAHGGIMTMKDLANYTVKVLEPIKGSYAGYQVLSMPPPSSGGITLIELLNVLSYVDLMSLGQNSAQTLHYMIEAMNLAYNDRNTLLGDPEFTDIPMKKLLSKAYAKQLYQRINPRYHTPSKDISTIKAVDESQQTTHYSIVDQENNMVANTYTLNYSFGNARIVPGTGILMNNELLDFNAKPGFPNPFGLLEGELNAIAPNKQPLSSMTPVLLLTASGKPFLATGSPGGSRIITTILQFLINKLTFDNNMGTATAMSRIHSQLWPDRVRYEQGISPDTVALLEKMGHQMYLSPTMGSVQSVESLPEAVYLGFSDTRRPGAGVVSEEMIP